VLDVVEAELEELELVVPQPRPVPSHLHGTHAEPAGSKWQPAPIPQLVIAVHPICVQNHSDWPTSAKHSGAIGNALHSPPPGVQ